MAQSVRSTIETRSARLRLPGRKDPYWTKLQRGLSVGYHRPISGGAGTWWGRCLVGTRYRIASLATADDHSEADGETILNWSQVPGSLYGHGLLSRRPHPKLYGTSRHATPICDDLSSSERLVVLPRGAAGRLRKHVVPPLSDRKSRYANCSRVGGMAQRHGPRRSGS